MHAAPLASAEIYNPATSGFSTTGRLASARIAHTATLLNNGQVLITGGNSFTAGCGSKVGSSVNGMSSAELYTPAVLVPAPALFSTSGEGKGQGARANRADCYGGQPCRGGRGAVDVHHQPG